MTTAHPTGRYTCHRDRDGCDDTWDICAPDGEHLVSVPFWGDDPESASRAEAKARLLVDRLNEQDELVAALGYLLEQTVDLDLKYGIALSEGEHDARAKALAAIAGTARPATQPAPAAPPDTAHTPEPWTHNDTAIVQDSRGRVLADCSIAGEEGQDGLPQEEVANARRLCAAVNACQGLSTEALERGVIAELRHALGILLDAAGDLDAAIDGGTGEFDDERARLNAAIRSAQTSLDAGPELDLHEMLAARGQIALGWSIEDVQAVRPDLTNEQAWQVLQQIERKHDASIGINWDTLEWIAEELFGSAPETDSQQEQP